MLDNAVRWLAAKVGSPETRSAILGISPRLAPDLYLAAAYGRQTTAGVPINAAQAMGISAFWRGVNLYARTIAALDLRVVVEHPGGGFTPARDDPRADLLRKRPNRETTRQRFWEALMGHALTQKHGGFAEIEWSARGLRPLGLHLMDPRNTVPVIRPDRSVAYRFKAGSDETMPAADVINVGGLGWDGVSGYDLVGLAAETLGLARAQILYAGALYGNGAIASGYIEVPGNPTPIQLAQMRAEINAVHEGSARAGKFGFLTGGSKFNQVSYTPNDARIVEAKRQAILEIANLLGVPPHMLGLMDGATVGNAEQQSLDFVKFSLLPWLRAIEQELEIKLFSAQERNRGLTVRHDTRELERGNMVARMTYWDKRVALGSASPNMVALAEGDEPSPEPAADERYITTANLTPLSQIGRDVADANEEPDADAAIDGDGAAQPDDDAG